MFLIRTVVHQDSYIQLIIILYNTWEIHLTPIAAPI